MVMGSVDGLLAVWDEFARRREAGEHALKLATIFTHAANEEDPDADGILPDSDFPGDTMPPAALPKRDRLQAIVEAYNARYGIAESVLNGNKLLRLVQGSGKAGEGARQQAIRPGR